jgi:serine protease Do
MLKNFVKLTACSLSILTFASITSFSLLPQKSDRVLAQTADEKIANQVYKKANCATVTIKSGGGHGSGFIVNSEGLIITNAHVLQDGPSVVTVIFYDGKKVSGDVVGFAKNGLDLAAVKIPKQPNLCKLALANPNSIQAGYNVFAIGTPLNVGNANTFSQGIISNPNARKGMIQHTAVIKHGNSGGPLLNSNGELIGVNTEGELETVLSGLGEGGVITASGIGFAIPVTQVKSFLTAINKGDISPVSTLPKDDISLQPLTLNGANINGNLTKDQPGKLYIFKGKAGQKITVEMDSNDFDPKLVLYKEIPLENNEYQYQQLKESIDKAPGDVNAILEITLPEDGNYVIVAISKIDGGIGAYSLRGFSN